MLSPVSASVQHIFKPFVTIGYVRYAFGNRDIARQLPIETTFWVCERRLYETLSVPVSGIMFLNEAARTTTKFKGLMWDIHMDIQWW